MAFAYHSGSSTMNIKRESKAHDVITIDDDDDDTPSDNHGVNIGDVHQRPTIKTETNPIETKKVEAKPAG